MNRIYCDANIVIAIFVREASSLRIQAWVADPSVSVVMSDLTVLEFTSAISRLVRERKLDMAEARSIFLRFETWRAARGRPLAITRQMFAIARTIVEDAALGVRGPDALHLALLQVTGLPFATFDALEPPPL